MSVKLPYSHKYLAKAFFTFALMDEKRIFLLQPIQLLSRVLVAGKQGNNIICSNYNQMTCITNVFCVVRAKHKLYHTMRGINNSVFELKIGWDSGPNQSSDMSTAYSPMCSVLFCSFYSASHSYIGQLAQKLNVMVMGKTNLFAYLYLRNYCCVIAFVNFDLCICICVFVFESSDCSGTINGWSYPLRQVKLAGAVETEDRVKVPRRPMGFIYIYIFERPKSVKDKVKPTRRATSYKSPHQSFFLRYKIEKGLRLLV